MNHVQPGSFLTLHYRLAGPDGADLINTFNDKPATLSLGQQKLLGVARALATRPKVVLLDEPAAGLDTVESETLGRRLHDIVEHDIAVLLIDHDMSLVLNLCDQINVLNFGVLIASGPPEQIRRDPAVVDAYLGSTHAEESIA